MVIVWRLFNCHIIIYLTIEKFRPEEIKSRGSVPSNLINSFNLSILLCQQQKQCYLGQFLPGLRHILSICWAPWSQFQISPLVFSFSQLKYSSWSWGNLQQKKLFRWNFLASECKTQIVWPEGKADTAGTNTSVGMTNREVPLVTHVSYPLLLVPQTPLSCSLCCLTLVYCKPIPFSHGWL